MKQGIFSKNDIEFLIKNYDSMTINEICLKLDRSIDSVRYKASNLHLKAHKDSYYIDKMKIILEENNYYLLSKEYVGLKEKYQIKCNEHNVIKYVSGDSIVHNKFRCDICKAKVISDSQKINIDTVRQEFYNKNLIPLFTDDDYKNNKEPLKYQCKIHNDKIQYITYDSLKRSMFACRFCAARYRAKFIKGKLSPLWKGGKRNNYQVLRDSLEYKEWRSFVFKRDNYICQCCGAKNGNGHAIKLRAHHKENFADNPDLRFDINNGITLCDKCHDPNIIGSFHNLYGTHYNNTKQLNLYIKNNQIIK